MEENFCLGPIKDGIYFVVLLFSGNLILDLRYKIISHSQHFCSTQIIPSKKPYNMEGLVISMMI